MRGWSASLWAAALLATMVVPATAALAQNRQTDSARVRPTSSRGRLPIAGCAGQPISDIVVITQPPYTERLPRQLEFIRRAARVMHATTHDEKIRQFVLMKPGEPCNQIRRAESERILRAQPFLVDARIAVYDDEAGGVRLEVETRDEFSLIFEPAINATSPPLMRAIRLGESNLGGTARLAAVEWREGMAYNDVLGARYTDYQLWGDRNELRLFGIRTPRGQELRAAVVRPYYTDLQRFAFIGSIDGQRDYASFVRPFAPPASVKVTRQTAVLGGITRIGSVGRLKLAGLTLTHSRQEVDTATVVIGRDGFERDIWAPLGTTFREQKVVRANALLGIRALRFTRVQGFDALSGTQDVRVGMQLGGVYGQSLGIGAARDRDRFVAGGLYAGAGGSKTFIGTQFVGEARFDPATRAWDNHIVSGRLAWYFRPAVRQLTLISSEWSAGHNMRTPFQLSLGDRIGGLMGHRNSQESGGRRVVVRAEQRAVMASRLNVADLGMAGFAEAGRLWRDPSVPYSMDTPYRGAVGVSLLGAVPPRSRRLWRVDFAFPVGSDPNKRFEVRVSNEDRTREFWREPRDVLAARERTVPSSLFTWP